MTNRNKAPVLLLFAPVNVKTLVSVAKFKKLLHTSSGGKVQLSARLVGREVEISIRDNGVGIHADDLPRIFERFYKADRARNRGAVSGTGLGLAIAKHIVLAHQGRIWAESKLGKGSKFFFSLPVADV